MIAQQNEYISDASQTLYELNADEIVRQKCRAQEEYQKLQNSINKKMAELTEERDTLTEEKSKIIKERDTLAEENSKLTDELKNLRARLAQYEEI